MIIYKTTNLINGKCYIGKDKYNNPKYLGSGKLLKQAIDKYGIENFKKEIIYECQSLIEQNIKEKEFIKHHNSFTPNGYNIASGGDGGDIITFNPNRKEICLKLSNSHKGKTLSDSGKEKCAMAKRGNKNPAKSREVKIKISLKKKGNCSSENNSMYGTSRKNENLLKLKERGIQLKGDAYEYLRKKIKCINIETNEIQIFDGVKELLDTLKINKRKYYAHLKDSKPILNKFICEILNI